MLFCYLFSFEGPIPELLIAMRSDVRKIRIDGQHYKNVVHNRLVQDVISLDVDIQSKMLYLADFLNQSIVRASLENNDKIEHVVKNVQKPEGIAFDWISKKIYWISTHPKCTLLAPFDIHMLLFNV